MMYSNKFAIAVKVNGKVLREEKGNDFNLENNDIIYIPFGSEYSLLLKNLNNTKAVVKIEIDGKDIGNGIKLIVDANSTVELQSNLIDDQAFKFIEKTEEISNYRGDKIGDGLIRIEYWFEKSKISSFQNYDYYPIYNTNISNSPNLFRDRITCENTIGGINSSSSSSSETVYRCGNYDAISMFVLDNFDTSSSSVITTNYNNNDKGITVKDSKTGQDFNLVDSLNTEDNSNVMIIQLKGIRNYTKVNDLKYTKEKIECPTCGKKNKSYAKFCVNCGTALD